MRIFIAGPRAISKLDKTVEDKLDGIRKHNHTVLVGDAAGVDRAVQQYFSNIGYRSVVVYASNGKARNNLGNWNVEAVPVPPSVTGFELYAAKDRAMADSADYGFMIWNGKSKGTLNNIINLLNERKKILVFFCPESSLVRIDCFEQMEMLLCKCNDDTKSLYAELHREPAAAQMQMSLF